MADTQSTISDIKLFIEQLKKDLPEVFGAAPAPGETAPAPTAGKVLYRGDLLEARVHLTPDQECGVQLAGSLFNVYLQSADQNPADLLTDWLRAQANDVLRVKTREWAEKMGVEYNNVTIKDQHTLWASCSAKKNINYSYRLLKMPEVITNYLIVHELAHLVHMNHGPQYWELVAQFCPDYKAHRKWLNDHKDAVFAPIEVKYIPQSDEAPAGPDNAAAQTPETSD